jgi:hypothetical protein
MVAVLNWTLAHWWLIFCLSMLGVFDWVREFAVAVAEGIGGLFSVRHRRKLELARAQAKAAKAMLRAAEAQHHPLDDEPLPAAPCRHRNVTSVRSAADDSVVAWLCRGCGTQLPADFSVYQEDL